MDKFWTGQYFCPKCGEQNVFYTEVPESRLTYRDGDENHTEHMPEIHDCECVMCGTEFLLLTETPCELSEPTKEPGR